MAIIEARGLRKRYRQTTALDGVDFKIEPGRIVGLIGPNGAGKSTALGAILGLLPFDGDLKVLGRDPWKQRAELMRDVSFIADVAVLPRWIKVEQAVDFVEGVHPALRPRRRPRCSCLEPTSASRAACANCRRAWSPSCISRW